ncbi:MAG: 4-hydroxy-3-methylbut-2-enyl diphosphate reductase [Bacteroidetes bacterium 4572_77]|nr:MAG: 4-hydroxy-3-methylbut-2-enyl diphosphate reductase [Bacteroidetes bacterium 4572_77]
MNVQIDPGAGPCYGVDKAIKKAELFLNKDKTLICNGDLIHNEEEIARLQKKGLQNLDLNSAIKQHKKQILFRAHGEPPSSYKLAEKHHIKVIDTTCYLVKNLQKRISQVYEENKTKQIAIFGHQKHPEIISLQGHCNNTALIIENKKDLYKLDFTKPLHLFSQTTKYKSAYLSLKALIETQFENNHLDPEKYLFFESSSCPTVSKRDQQLKAFFQDKDLLIFVSGKRSTNGRQLYEICSSSGIESHFISTEKELQSPWFKNKKDIGISGATSTPLWQLEEIKKAILSLPQ